MSVTYTDGEKILAYHGQLIYEAKILKVESRPDAASSRPKPFYFIHYNGWKDRYNEWVDESRIMKWSDENLAKQAALKEELGPDKNKKEKKEKKTPKTGTVKRKKREDGDDEVESSAATAKFELPIPKELQRRLYEDWEKITKQKMLVPLPRSPTVEEILDAFAKSLPSSGANEKEIIDGIRGYFELALGTLLLYRFERVQFDAFARSNLTQVYGAEHLLRLLVKIPELLVHVEIDEEVREQLRQMLQQLLIFMLEKPHLVFSAQAYTPAPPNYIKQVES